MMDIKKQDLQVWNNYSTDSSIFIVNQNNSLLQTILNCWLDDFFLVNAVIV